MNIQGFDLSRYRTVAVSPHFDDVALSMSAILMNAAHPVAVVTVHGGQPPSGMRVSSWDYDCGFASPGDAYKARVDEDARACALLGADRILLANPDGPYRTAGPLAGLDELVRAVATTADLYLPAGVNQPDHLRVRNQALDALGTDGRVRPFFYADLPYSAATPNWATAEGHPWASPETWPAELADLGRRYPHGLDVSSVESVTGSAWDAKRNVVLCHASQLPLVACMAEVAGTAPLLGVSGLLTVEAAWRASVG